MQGCGRFWYGRGGRAEIHEICSGNPIPQNQVGVPAQHAKGVLLVAVYVAWVCSGRSCSLGHSHWCRCRDPCDRWWPGLCGGAALARGVLLVAQEGLIRIGKGGFVGPGSIIVSKASISIGEDVLVAERVTIRD